MYVHKYACADMCEVLPSLSSTAPSAVRNLTATCSAVPQLQLTWERPEAPNGAVSYNVSVTAVDLATGSPTNTEMVHQDLNFTLNAEPYTQYTASIVAETSAGQSKASMATCETAEGGRLSLQCIPCSSCRSTCST